MKSEQVTMKTKADFVNFCIKHRSSLDESFLSDQELINYSPELEPAYMIRDDKGKVIGAVSLLKTEEYITSKKSRFRILFSELPDKLIYQELITSILSHINTGDYTYTFSHENHNELRMFLEEVGFHVERYVFVMERENLEGTPFYFPKEYLLRRFIEGEDEQFYCNVRNEAFKQLIGYTPLTIEALKDAEKAEDFIIGGTLLLFHKEKPIGVVRTGKEYFSDAYYATVNSLAVIPEYQGRGLGRHLLRACLTRGREENLEKGFLCVNAENDGAAKLYEQEGFYKTESFVCYFLVKS